MINGYPTEEELRGRINRQLEWRNASQTAALIWHGYLSALLEWGLLDVAAHDRLIALLPPGGSKEVYELFVDKPLTSEQEREIDEQESRRDVDWR
jgi:hypothetical protein